MGACYIVKVLTGRRAGGGGSKSKHRKTKLREKNLKLAQERQRAAQEARKGNNEVKMVEKEPEWTGQDESIHPSRRSRIRTK